MEEIKFLEKTHEYILNGKAIPSVTQILQPISKVLYENIEMPTLRNKAKIGTSVHRYIELYNKFGLMVGEDEEERVRNYFNQYLEWNKTLKQQETLENEFKGYYQDNKFLFAGTIDNIRKIGDKIYLIDYKTVANPNETLLSLQLYGYKLIAEKTLGITIDEFCGLCLKKDSYKLHNLTELVNDKKTKELFELLFKLNKALDANGIRGKAKQYNEENF